MLNDDFSRSLPDISHIKSKTRTLNWKSCFLDDCWFNNVALCVCLESLFVSLLRSSRIKSCLNSFSLTTCFFFQRCWTLQTWHCLMTKPVRRIIPEMFVIAQQITKFLFFSGGFVIVLATKSIARLGRCTNISCLLFLTARRWFFYRWARTCSLTL